MLNVTPISGTNQYAVAHYFSAADDYYAKEDAGEWHGIGAHALGLSGRVEQAQLARLLNGQLPNGEQIAATFDRDEHKKRMGLDLTFSAPKSVSMQALVAGDKDVTAAHDRAVTRALQEVERLAGARRKVKGKSYRERTGNLVIGKFRHEMSRAKDPQLHTHAVVLNMTQRKDGAWRALSNEDIFKVQHTIDALYKAELARELRGLGYSIRLVDDRGGFELAHISREQIESFSARSRVIEEALASEGKSRATATTFEKQVIALASRPRKDERDRAIIKQYWVEKSCDLGIDYDRLPMASAIGGLAQGAEKPLQPRRGAGGPSLPAGVTPARVVVDYALTHLTEREAVVRESALMATALRRAVGLAGADDVQAEIRRLVKQGTLLEAPPVYRMANQAAGPALPARGWTMYLRDAKGWSEQQAGRYVESAIEQGSLSLAERRFTTQKALKREQAMLAIERTGRSQVAPIMASGAVQKALERSTLNGGQRSVVAAILAASDRFVGIQGDAGTGKTYAVNQAVALIKQSRDARGEEFRTLALAPYGNQVKALKNEGLDAHTVASFLRAKDKNIDARTVVLLDESAVVGARQMEQLMKIVEKTGARMVMLGDTKQTEAIEAGKPFAQLQQQGMTTVRLSEIQRQKTPELREAVGLAAEAKTSRSLERIKYVQEVKQPAERHQAVVADFVALAPAERGATIIVAATNDARREINWMVRASLDLAGRGRGFDTLVRVDLTQAQRRFAPSYQRNMVIQPERDYGKAGLLRGETYHVREALPGNRLLLERPDGTTATINPRKVTHLSVYGHERTELAVGDTVRINRNDAKLDLTNGDRMRVVGIIGGVVRLESIEQKDGLPVRTLELAAKKSLHLEHAYASTVHSSQGLTSDRALIALDTRSRTTSMNLYYVAISRARYEARIYTNSVKELPAAIARRFDKTTAMSVHHERQVQRHPVAKQRDFSAQRAELEKSAPASDGHKKIQRRSPTDGRFS
jgi:conjugative relaxase-like TrwC/TraI family protein